jgi:copper(I)-binding protein
MSPYAACLPGRRLGFIAVATALMSGRQDMARMNGFAKSAAFALAAMAAACSGASDEKAQDASVTVDDAYIFAPRATGPTAGFMMLRAGGGDVLLGASSPAADTIEIHTMSMADGVMTMRPIESLNLPAGEAVALEPGGLHLMLFGVDGADLGVAIPVTLDFETAPDLTIDMEVRQRTSGSDR